MNYLLDVNILLQGIWSNHPKHEITFNWLDGKSVTVCPLAELGFVRISNGTLMTPMKETRKALSLFLSERKAARIADDLPALDSNPATSAQVTDNYLATLAQKHGIKLATSDKNIKHPSVVVVD